MAIKLCHLSPELGPFLKFSFLNQSAKLNAYFYIVLRTTKGFPGGSVVRIRLQQWRRHGFQSMNQTISWGRNGNPLQHSCLENFTDRAACGLQSVGLQRAGHDLATEQPQQGMMKNWDIKSHFQNHTPSWNKLKHMKQWTTHSKLLIIPTKKSFNWKFSSLVIKLGTREKFKKEKEKNPGQPG